ncbi:MAG: efflux transporter outer membrane subunit [Hyphomicrobiaceae bacterium]|nr:efflux transporter outer membrane subunit [Hyphomicrobiaceae bacterium]
MPAAALAAALTLGLLAGCTSGPNPLADAAKVPETFQAARTTQATDISRWYARFGSGELNKLVGEANIGNLDVAIAVAQLMQADAQVQIAAAALFPTINYSDTSQRAQSSGTTVPGTIAQPVQRNSFSKVISASYVLDIWGQNRDALQAAVRTATASAYQIETVRLTALASVVNNYLTYAANRERVAVGGENLANAERVLRVIRDRRAAGTASELDEAQQQSLVEGQRASIATLRQTAETSRIAIALLLGQPAQTVDLKVRRVRSLTVPRIAPGIPATLLARRPDIRDAERQLAAGEANVEVARKAFLPTIQLTGQAGYQSAALSTLLRPESFIYSIAAGITQPIFDGGRLRGQMALSEAQRQQLLETYRRAIVTALSDVETALVAVRETRRREAAQRLAVIAARRAFTLSEERLRAGTIDLTTLLTTQNTLFSAEDTLIQVRLARLQAAAALFQALGGDWDEALIYTTE